TELREALDADGLVLEFQPERRIAGAMGQAGTIRSVEALVRWRHESRGVIPPAVFLPMAEESGLIERIGTWVLRRAVAQARTWQTSDPAYRGLSVAVNLSPRELARQDLVAVVRQVLADACLEPGTLTLEITEAAMVRDRPAAIVTLGALQSLGVRIALDDCVGGPDTVDRLRDVPLDLLKLDPSLIAGLGAGGANDDLRTLVSAARTLGLQTVGEGVETRQQLATLRDSGCDLAQGYFFGRPLGAAGITALLRAERRRRPHASSGPR
ncbi:MAG: EAL domain-containing protein, partial [Chloroflexota bacterium]|nr:EAL domain-containing protein [Chloroflexota bacterium]